MTKEEMGLIRDFVANIQSLKDAHINDGLPINYGMLCTITTNGWKLIEELKALEQESQTFEWCTDCREYDQEKHCCHRWSKVIRDTVEEIKETNIRTAEWVLLDECSNSGYYCSHCHKKLVKEGWSNTIKKINYCPNCGARMIEPQESEETK